MLKQQEIDIQFQEILNAVLALGNMNFSCRAPVMGQSEQMDTLAAAINMLGEELKSNIILVEERNLLIKEIHHRVKNNLQIISSILNLQASYIDDPTIVQKFMDCRIRINSIALIHEQLYQSDNFEELEVNTYFSSLCHQLENLYGQGKDVLAFLPGSTTCYMNVDQIVPLALLVNELIINSFKHGDTDSDNFQINVEINIDDQSLHFSISDNGKGFNDEEKFYHSDSLGLQLVHSLVDQLDAKLSFQPNNPYKVELRIARK